jgi:hypothetical protein
MTMKTGRPKTTGHYATREELVRRIRLDYISTSYSLRVIANRNGVSVATAWRIATSEDSTKRLTST